jgi:uncharacterized protein with GYD domain
MNPNPTPVVANANGKKIGSFFLLQGKYSSYTWIYRVTTDANDFRRPPDMAGLLLQLGAKVHGIWYSFGEYDLVGIFELEKAEDMAALMIGLKAGWEGKAFDDLKATSLLTQDEAAKACVKASEGLKKSRDASKEGPLQGTMDYSNADFSKVPAK